MIMVNDDVEDISDIDEGHQTKYDERKRDR
jgi:hypothetical protein